MLFNRGRLHPRQFWERYLTNGLEWYKREQGITLVVVQDGQQEILKFMQTSTSHFVQDTEISTEIKIKTVEINVPKDMEDT